MTVFPGVRLKNRGCRFPGYIVEMYCHCCGRFYCASNTGSACSNCRSTHVVPAGGYMPARTRGCGGRVARVL
ncbi:hypothetical protein [uncultured Desulfobacter sp.]|uniref:hypothetical protein n=1 Tax=uncultured Desulfobacter sp. TaxID=240139 RepID=UPI002AAC1CC8|nr:hypothetical protein [uncultured Desulfobacter sp.]